MNTDFPRIISTLRKEMGKTQKSVADDLGISQALLSHYEKGTRECNFDFLLKLSDYYNVSVDYLLGKSINKSPQDGTIDLNSNISHNRINIITMLNKKIITGTIDVLYDLLEEIGNKGLNIEMSNYIMQDLYMLFRMIYSSNNKNLKSFFNIPEYEYKYKCSSFQFDTARKVSTMLNGFKVGDYPVIRKMNLPDLNNDIIKRRFPENSNSILNLIKNVEKKIDSEL